MWSIPLAAVAILVVMVGDTRRQHDEPNGRENSGSRRESTLAAVVRESVVAVADTPPRRRRRRAEGSAAISPGSRDTLSPSSDTTGQEDEPSEDLPASSAPITPPRGGHEPPGFTPLAVRSFSDASEPGWHHRRTPAFELLNDPGAPESPPYVARAIYRAGMRGGVGPVMEARELGKRYSSVYASMWVRFSSNWQGHPSGSNKIFHLWIAGQNKVVLKAQGIGQRPLELKVNLQGIHERPVSRTLQSNAMNRGQLSRGDWHRLEILVRSNTGGNSDGLVEWWLDGNLIGSYSNISYVRSEQDHVWSRASWNPTWGGVGGVLSQDQTMDMDHIYVSGQ